MMRVKAKVSFSGVVSMAAGTEMEIADKAVLQDLLRAGYVEEINPKPEESDTTKAAANKAKAGGKNEGKRTKQESNM